MIAQDKLSGTGDAGLVRALRAFVNNHEVEPVGLAEATTAGLVGRGGKLKGDAITQLPRASTADLVESCSAAEDHTGKQE